ncbi:guanine nucleotide exchange factor spike 1 [Nicotiana attenuata]|uniref:Guanine nucleotide exchange factor spike 1 n=1 Tax=Nicotiana attenuata TaxID=49451 RepID=A0A314KUV8_NICAT|nr:guanine nucleotide exchange factor spike 1 [Nicotiana attenuata]
MLSLFFLFSLQLDENLEQWPHLNELVQCYRTDWVKDENKYGHYESVSPASFQNQIYEGPDTDIETVDLSSGEGVPT